MEKLLQQAMKTSDESEVFNYETCSGDMSIENEILNDIGGSLKSGYALRIIKKGLLGTAYSNNLAYRKNIVSGATTSLAGKVGAGFGFPDPSKLPNLDYYDRRTESVTYSNLYENGQEIIDYYNGRVKGQLNVFLGFKRESRRVINSNGVNYKARTSYVYSNIQMLYPKTTIGLGSICIRAGPMKTPKKMLQEHLDLYDATIPVIDVDTGEYPVMFLPYALFPIMWRISEGANGKNIYDKTSPLAKKFNKKVISDKISIIDDPLDAKNVNAVAFDDEGVATRKLELFRKGVFKSCYVNLDYAAKLKMKPTGTGFRDETFMAANPIRIQPMPNLKNLSIAYGKERFGDMVQSMDKGIIVNSVIGPHSGNILNGDFSVGLSPGFYVKKGEIVGRVKDALISGNIYEMLKNVSGVEDRAHYPDSFDRNPSILFDKVKVSAK